MKINSQLIYKNYYLNQLKEENVNEKYLKWVCDKEITEFLEIKYETHTIDKLKTYVESCSNSNSKYLFGIFDKNTDNHIGNASVNDININTRTFNCGWFIGEKNYWGKNASIAAQLLLFKFAFDILELRKFFGGVYANHLSSRFVLKRIGCNQEARLKEKFLHKGRTVDQIIYTLDRKEWPNVKKHFQL